MVTYGVVIPEGTLEVYDSVDYIFCGICGVVILFFAVKYSYKYLQWKKWQKATLLYNAVRF